MATSTLLPRQRAGGTVDLSCRVTANDANANTIQNPTVSWSSLNTGVATVSGAGVVTAVANGVAKVVAMVDAAADTATVTVDIKQIRQLEVRSLRH